MDINLNYVPNESMGYGRLGVKVAEEFQRRGVEVYRHLPSPEAPTHPERNAGIASNVCWVSVPTHAQGWWEGQTASIFTMWEATNLPESFREALHTFDNVIVPSAQNVELFSPFHDNIHEVHLGVDPTEWHLIDRPEPGVFFDFLIGGSGARKGTDLAYKAFLAAFPNKRWDGPIPRLVMKNPRRDNFEHSRLMMIGGRISPEAEQALYASAHCYLQPSRGEGFGLQPLQAIAQGLPTILTGAHGHASFADLGMPIDSTFGPASYFIYGEPGDWWEPDFDQLVERMRWVYDNWGLAVEQAKVGAGVVAERFTWANTVDRLMEILDLSAPLSDKGRWVEPAPLKFLVRVDRELHVNAAGLEYHFLPGHDHWVPADVKRILAEGGHLAASCIREFDGLTDEQVARLGGSDEHLFCSHCGQKYNSGTTRADEILADLERDIEADRDLTRWHAGA